MTKQPTILIASYLEPQHVERIRTEVPDVNIIYRPDLIGEPRYIADHSAPVERSSEQESEWQALLGQADILFDFDLSHREDLPDLATNVRWIQSTSAGIGQFVRRMGYAERMDCVFTTASGVHARPLAEFALMAMLMFAKNYQYLEREKTAHHWERYCATELAGKTLAVVGLGKIGREVARLAKAFEMRVIGTRRDVANPVNHVDVLYAPSQLDQLLPEADFLVLATPHTPETERLIGADQLAKLPQGAVIINIARGVVIDQNALVYALQSGRLGGAALDVFDPEPLPADSPLWDMPQVIISPHSASTAETENYKITQIFIDNLRRYLAGETMHNILDTDRLY